MRLAVLSAVLAALVIGASFAALSVRVRNSTKRLFADELSRNGRTLVALQRDSRRQLVLTASLLSESPTLRSAISTYRLERRAGSGPGAELVNTVQHVLERTGGDLGGGLLLATDERGRVIAGYARGAHTSLRGLDLSALPAERNALDPSLEASGDALYLSALEVDHTFYSVGVAPLILDGYTIGTIVFGNHVDSNVVRSLRRDFDGHVVISAGQTVISSTLPTDQARVVSGNTGEFGPTVTLGDEEYLIAVIPLGKTQTGTALRITLLQPLTGAVRSLTSALSRDFLLYGTLAVVLAALGAALLSRTLLRPLRGFISFMRAGAERERVDRVFDAHDASQEIRVLNESFNQLMAALGKKRGELERRGAELAAANAVLSDEIRERERVERALRESEAQLRQSQKLEAIGTLAGGIAHDFNNMLTVISGFTQMAMSALDKDHEIIEDLKQVADAAHSAAGLTHQLLAFSRKQVMQPRILDLEFVVRGMEGMMRRLIGPHILLEVVHAGEPARIKADPGQLEQVLLNLVVNARDAMPGGGTLTITTGYRVAASGAACVTLCVRDSGVGMPPDVIERIFEPFFTTKEVGKGTGLGLSTVYGIVIQSGGTIDIESEVGNGTSFLIAFPAVLEMSTPRPGAIEDASLPRGDETILVVDDEDAVLDYVARTLEGCGYTVLAAHGGVEALTYARTTPHIDVLLTDVLMPQLSGPQLVERYLAQYPAPTIIYMTGYVDDDTMQLELDEQVIMLRKPFTASELAQTLRSVLDARSAASMPADAR